IACINFMNLTTARSAHRAKEVGVRKVLGGQRSTLASQFLSESVLMAAIAVILAVGITLLMLPAFSELANRQLEFPWGNGLFWLALAAGIGLVGLIAGSYPAFFLSAFDSIQVLKGQLGGQAKHSGLRNGLVVFQFATAVILIIATLLVYQQLNFIRNKQLGYHKEQVIILNDAYALDGKVQAFKQEMLKNPAVEQVSVSSYLPVPSSRSNTSFTKSREFRDDNSVNMQSWVADYDYLSTLGMEMAQGRFFDKGHPSDSLAIVLNETAAKKFGFDGPIGKKVYTIRGHFQGQPTPEDFLELTVIGVVKDFHWESLRQDIGSLGISLGEANGSIAVRYQAGKSDDIIAAMESTWKQLAPAEPFSYRFLDDSFARVYEAEQRVGTIAGIFALLAILISCLGLFGLASFMAEQRTKEIGIRKVLGATAGSLMALLSKDFLRLVLFAIIIAAPVGWWAMNKWLADFAYHIDINWWVFAVAGISAIGIAVLTVSYQSIKAALANPVKSLRSE
ncbi:MAG: FtsX-like permease family protein, partial [Phaeodactylibacter sp.]|nr:FtsX-like permease family protein [Phaeodactylibacter sp.]